MLPPLQIYRMIDKTSKEKLLKKNSHAQTQDKDVCWPETKQKQIKWDWSHVHTGLQIWKLLKQPGDFIVRENGKSQEPELPNITEDQIQFWKAA